MALGLLYILKDFDPFRNTSRLALLLNRKYFDILIDNLGGTTITLPTRQEVNCMLKSLVYYQIKYVEDKGSIEARRLSGITDSEAKLVDKYASMIKAFFNKYDQTKLRNQKFKDVIDTESLFTKQVDE